MASCDYCFVPCCAPGTDAAALTTVDSAPDQGTATNSNSPTGLESLICSLGRVGVVIAGAATGRPVVNTRVGNQNIPTLGNKPLVTGQVSANEVVIIAGIALVAVALILANRR